VTWSSKIVGWDDVAPESLLAHPSNFRRHPAAQREALRGSLNELDIIAPVIVNRLTGHVLDGHARVEEYLSAGVALVPVAYVEVAPEKEALALLSLDPIAAMAEADKEALDSLLREVSTGEAGLQKMLAELAKDAGLYLEPPKPEDPGAQMDKAEELREKWQTERGQIWQVGRHRVMCGDMSADMDALLAGAIPEAVVTDPPYKMNMGGGGCFSASTANIKRRVKDIIDFDPGTLQALLKLGAPTWYLFCNKDLIPAYLRMFDGYRFNILVWAKTNPTPWTNETFLPDVEYVMFFCRDGRVWNNHLEPTATYSKFYLSSKLQGRADAGGDGEHPTMKPVELLMRYLSVSTAVDGTVLDPFLGSGSTAVAAEQTNRVCCGMEIEPRYVAVTLERLSGMGLTPCLLEDGASG
jgi:DNA modification methylase